ncbi:MAG: putative O-glycosylation ligase, exosortase A system-associated [Betaproteobacteria bacterium]|nr:putative O-glycosylation ligase, exosortase A system-associated [Betaproteobacteria bacterium]
MRDLAVLLPILVIAIMGLKRPWIGVLGWTWISIMNPHRLSYAAATMQVAALMAGCTLLGLLFTREKRSPFIGAPVAALTLFILWMCITYPFAIYLDENYSMWSRVMKIDLMILVAIALLQERKQIVGLVWVLVGSLGFFGVKGGLFTLMTGGNFRVWGPEGSFIEGNNEIALALIVIIPLMRFLQMQTSSERKWVRPAFSVAMGLCAVAAIGSHSRGALLAIVAMAAFLWWRSPNKISGGIAFVVVGMFLAAFMPSEWTDRMNTIETYDKDASAMGRINAWWMAWNLAQDHFFGGGFSIYNREIFQLYAPDPTDVHAAHSIYFQVLGEHGFIGLFLFLLIWFYVWRTGSWLRKHGSERPDTRWVADLGAMCQVSLVGYLVGGAFLSLAYFDLPYNLLVLVVVAKRWVMEKRWEKESLIEQTEKKKSKAKLKRTSEAPT